jgi:ribonuclease T2
MFETCESEFEVEGFFIHGLWPNRKSGDHPSYCAEMFMDRPPLPTKLKLMQNWKALHGDNTALWRHEWKKHGTCITQTSDDYFNLALRLFEEHPVMPRLEKFKLKPSIQTFTKTTLAKSYFRKNVELHCKKTYLGTVLTEVGLCFTLDGKAID